MSSSRREDAAEKFDPADRLGYLLKHAHRRLNGAVSAALLPYEVDPRELVTMAAVAAGQPVSQHDVASRLGVDRTTMVAIVDSLEQKALLERHPDPSDRRRNLLGLTASGRERLTAATGAASEAEREVLRPLGARQEREFRAALRRLADL